MTQLTGSEKQIEWAKKIIANIEKSARETIDVLNKKGLKGKDEKIKEISEVFEYIPKIKNASRVIDMRIVAEKAKTGLVANWRMIAAEVALMAGIRL